jgi:hypothetical protein
MLIFEHTPPLWTIVTGVLLVLVAGGFSVWLHAPRFVASYLIGALFALFLLLLGWCMLMPGRRSTETRELKPRFVIAVDTSRSMLLRPNEQVPTRWDLAREALAMPWLKSVQADCEIDLYAFDAEVGKKLGTADLSSLEPRGDSTLLRDALQKITGRYAGVNVVGGLVLSDGNDTREASEDWSAETRPFPLYTVALEPEAVWKVEPDLRVDMVQTPRRVSVGWTTELKAMISGEGSGGRAVNVGLYKDGVLQEEAPVQIPEDGGSRQTLFELQHPDVGVFTYRVVAPPLPGESNTNDNEFAVTVQVIDSKNRLIYVEGPPRWESKYLKRALQANKQATPLIFLQGPDGKPLALGPAGSMTADLTEQQLSFFKIVIVGNLDAGEIGERRVKDLIHFVETGGSLVLLGGTKAWSEKGFPSTGLQAILPVKGVRGARVEGEFPVSLTAEGRAHAAFAGDPELWAVIPPVLSVFPVTSLSPAAQAMVAAETPAGAQPVVVSQRYGQGKVVAILTDSLWEWQLHPSANAARPYQRFWDQLIAWLLPEKEEIEKDRLELATDKETVVIGEEIRVTARLGGDGENRDIAVRCEIALPDGTKAPFSLRSEIVTTASGKAYPGFATSYKAVAPGLHQVTASALVDGKPVVSDPLSFFVKAFSPESAPRPVAAKALRQIADASGGRFFQNLDDLNDALSELAVRRIEESLSKYDTLWQHAGMLGALMALAALGWVVRKLNNMP